jgi:arylsulfatase A-like enzyme
VFGLLEGTILLGLQESGLATWQWIRDGVGPPILWISPAFDLLLFSAVGLLWAGVAAAFPGRNLWPWAAGFFAWMGFYASLAATGRLNDFACAALGLGLAVRLGCWFARHAERSIQIIQRTFLRVVLAAGGVACVVILGGWVQERILEPGHYAQLPAPGAQAPNVLFLVMDTGRADHFSSYDYPRATTPNFDRLAKEGALFLNAYSTSSWSLPSHASLVTGLLPREHGATLYPLRPEFVTLPEYLDARGYATAGFVANTTWCTRPTGFAQGFVHFEDYFGNWGDRISRTVYAEKAMDRLLEFFGVYRSVSLKSAADINRSLLAWLDRCPHRPFFIFVNYLDAHEPVFPPPPYDGMFGSPETVSRRIPFDYSTSPANTVSPEAAQAQHDAYDGAIAYMDAQLGALWAELERRGLAENTLLIVTADHGESLGEAGLYGHRSSLRLEQIHVPLLIRLPAKIAAGSRVSSAVSLKRIPATLAHLTGLESSAPFPGPSLFATPPADSQARADAEPVIAELTGLHDVQLPSFWPVSAGDLRSVITRHWQYIERSDGLVELYDLVSDRKEEYNLAQLAQDRGRVWRLGQRLARWDANERFPVRGAPLAPVRRSSSGKKINSVCARRRGALKDAARSEVLLRTTEENQK